MMMGVVIGITGALLPVVWRVGDRVITWGEARLAARRAARGDGDRDDRSDRVAPTAGS